MIHARTRRLTAGAVAMTLLGGLFTLFVIQPAQAIDASGLAVEVYREFASASAGTGTASFTARVQNPDGTFPQNSDIRIHWEVYGTSAGDITTSSGGADVPVLADAADTTTSPDEACTARRVTPGSNPFPECTISLQGGSATTALVRAWIDTDHATGAEGGGTEADRAEGRLSDADTDCNTELPPPAGTNPTNDLNNFNSCKTGAEEPGGAQEPDRTDVVQVTFTGASPVLRLDCPEVTAAPVSGKATVDCRVTDNASPPNPLPGYYVDGEHISGANDPDANGKSNPADYNGSNGSSECVSDASGLCRVTVPSTGPDTDNATICFWIDTDRSVDNTGPPRLTDPSYAEGGGGGDGGECTLEQTAGSETANQTDIAVVRWEVRTLRSVDVEPERALRAVNTSTTLTATVTDQFGDPWPGSKNITFNFRVGSANSAALSCATANSGESLGKCAVSYIGSNAGADTICGWYDSSQGCLTEEQATDSAANVDVVVVNWLTSASGGGATTTTSPPADDVSKSQGYTLVGADGGIFNFGTSQFHGSTGDMKLNQPVIGLANKKGGTGYWLVARDGGIFTFGDADFYGSTGDMKLNAPVLGMEATPTGKGYFLFAADGGIFTFGDAKFYGSTGDMKLNAPAVGLSINEDGDGYWLVAQDGGIFSFGDVPFHGSTGSMKLNQPVFDMAPTAGDKGYWLVAKDGGVFSFGDAENKFYGSAVGSASGTVIGMGTTPTFNGYWIADSAGGVYPFGDARALGDRRGQANNAPIVGFATVPKK